MKIEEMIKVMQHFADGGEVECAEIGFDEWEIANKPCWNWSDYNYRIKEPKQKITIEKWLLKDNNGDFFIREGDKNHIEYAFKNKVKLIESYEVEL